VMDAIQPVPFEQGIATWQGDQKILDTPPA